METLVAMRWVGECDLLQLRTVGRAIVGVEGGTTYTALLGNAVNAFARGWTAVAGHRGKVGVLLSL